MIVLYQGCDVFVRDLTGEPVGLSAGDGFYFYEGDFFSEENKAKKLVFSRWDDELKIERCILIGEIDLMIVIERECKRRSKNEENV